MEHLTQISIDRKDWAAEHKRTYLESGGARGHIVDLRDINGHGFTTCLVLKTIGRKTGEAHLAPLIYADMAGEVVNRVTQEIEQAEQGQQRLTTFGPRVMTNDIGEYRLFALPAGAALPEPHRAHDSGGAEAGELIERGSSVEDKMDR